MIRDAKMNDIDFMIALGKDVLSKSSNSFMEVDDNKCRRNMAMMIASKQFIAVVDEHEGKLRGFLFGMVESMFFTNVKYATDIAIISVSGNGAGMIKQFIKWAKAQGARSLMMGVSTNIDSERTGKLYQILGFDYVGGIFTKEI